MRKVLSITALFCSLMLAACGGSSDALRNASSTSSTSSTTGTSGTTGTGTTTTVKAASLTATSSATSIPSDGSASATITVLARNSTNNLISGVVVTFAADSGGVAVTNATTDATGAAVATLSIAGDPSIRIITVTATSGSLTASVKVQVVASSSATTSVVSALTMSTSAASILDDGSTTATITALARDASNNVLAGVPITFSASSGAVQAAKSTTDASGEVTATLSTGGDSSLRTITVTGTTAKLTSTVQVQVLAPSSPTVPVYSMGNGTGTGFVTGQLDLAVNDGTAAASLAAGGTTGLLLTIVDQTGTLYIGGPVVVTFSSPCIASGSSEILASGSTTAVTSITTTTGSINASYVAKGCTGADAIKATATVGGQNISASGTVTVAAAGVGSIQFQSATPTTIGLKGTGLTETSTVIFQVTDSSGGAKSGVPVTFSLDTTVGGLSLSPTTHGTVRTVVSSGTVHTAVRVTASIASPALSTESSQLTVTTGLPASDAFSIAVGPATYANGTSTYACPNVEAAGIDGVTVPFTVRLADRYNNPVPDGTSIAFTTDGGHIVGNCTTPASTPGDGTCSVTWTSADPRPGIDPTTGDINLTYGYPSGYPALQGAYRATIFATTIGEESFTDDNGSGFYQSGDPFTNLGEPYRDDDENGNYNLGDYFLDFNQNGKRDAGSGSFVGITCTGITAGSTCSTSTLAIGASHLLIMSTGAAQIDLYEININGGDFSAASGSTAYKPKLTIPVSTAAVAAVPPATTGTPAVNYTGSVTVQVQDNSCIKDTNGHCTTSGNSMAAGTTITAALDNSALGTLAVTPVTVGCNADLGGQLFTVSFTSATSTGSGNIIISVTSPGSGTLTTFPIAVSVQ